DKKTKELQNHGIDAGHAEELVRLYGSNIDRVIERMDSNAYDLPEVVYAQLIYGIEEESVVRAIDFLIRRTGAMFFDIDFVRQHKDGVLRCMADVFNWSDERLKEEREEVEKEIEIAVVPVTVES
ncbi:MAG: glycerol-3-phosphate dehydrogenase, partial [Exiguobacterium sp.]|nr:glycerol-3-phosphate dehydrogenase [Exiguobacterium sp.]